MFIELNLESSLLLRCILSYLFKKTDLENHLVWKLRITISILFYNIMIANALKRTIKLYKPFTKHLQSRLPK